MDIGLVELAASVKWKRVVRQNWDGTTSVMYLAAVGPLWVAAQDSSFRGRPPWRWGWSVSLDCEHKKDLVSGGETSGLTAAMAAGVAHARAIVARWAE